MTRDFSELLHNLTPRQGVDLAQRMLRSIHPECQQEELERILAGLDRQVMETEWARAFEDCSDPLQAFASFLRTFKAALMAG